MATVNMTAGSNCASIGGGAFRITNTIDLQAANDALEAAGDGPLVSTDIIQCLDIPAKTFVQNVFTRIRVASVATALTATVGDGTDPNGWDAEIDLEAAAGTVCAPVGGTDEYSTTNGVLYSAADTIDLVVTVNTITSLGSVDVIAICYDPSYV